MQAQTYEGYFENGRFVTAGKTINIPERQRVFITIFDSPKESDSIKEQLKEFDCLVDKSTDEILQEIDFPRLHLGTETFLKSILDILIYVPVKYIFLQAHSK